MDAAFWKDRWREGQIGFHEGSPNTALVQHADVLGRAHRVLVPLCGKSEDLAYLVSLGHEVIGVELAEAAVRAFFVDHGLVPTERSDGPARVFSAGAITLLVADFFDVTSELIGHVDGFYDRAAMIALPPPLRARYVAHLRALASGGSGLLVTFEYDDGAMEGPPFSIREPEVRIAYDGARVETLGRYESENARLRAAGHGAHTSVYAITL